MGFLRSITGIGSCGARFLPPVSPATPSSKRRASVSKETSFAGQSEDLWLSLPPEEPSLPGLPGSIDDSSRLATSRCIWDEPKVAPAAHPGKAPQNGAHAESDTAVLAPPAKKNFPLPRAPSSARGPPPKHRSPPPTVLTGPLSSRRESSGPDRWSQTARVKIGRMAQTAHGSFARSSWQAGATTASRVACTRSPVHRSASAPPPPGGNVTPVGDRSPKVSYFSDKRPGSLRRAAPTPLILPGSPRETARRRPINRAKIGSQ